MSDSPTPIVDVSRVTKQFRTVRAVDDLSFRVNPGEIFALLGPNGAGKTTVVRMIVDIFRCDAGDIRFSPVLTNGGSRPDPRLTAYLPEERGLHRDVTILRTLEYFAALRGMPGADARRAALEGLEALDLGGRGAERVDALSKGNQQKVQFLATFLHGPRFAVLDEPFSGLDPINQQRFLDDIRRRRDAGCTILLSAHQMDLVESIADRILVVSKGRAVLHGTLADIRRDTASGASVEVGVAAGARVELPPLEALPGVARVTRLAQDRVALFLSPDARVGDVLGAVTSRLLVTSVHSGTESLRDIFIRVVGADAAIDEPASDPEATRAT